jgi:hypothetical protein
LANVIRGRLCMVRVFGVQRLHHVADRELVDVDHLARERREPAMRLEPTRAAPTPVHLVSDSEDAEFLGSAVRAGLKRTADQKARVEPQGHLKTTILPAQATLDSRALKTRGALRVRSVVSVAV